MWNESAVIYSHIVSAFFWNGWGKRRKITSIGLNADKMVKNHCSMKYKKVWIRRIQQQWYWKQGFFIWNPKMQIYNVNGQSCQVSCSYRYSLKFNTSSFPYFTVMAVTSKRNQIWQVVTVAQLFISANKGALNDVSPSLIDAMFHILSRPFKMYETPYSSNPGIRNTRVSIPSAVTGWEMYFDLRSCKMCIKAY